MKEQFKGIHPIQIGEIVLRSQKATLEGGFSELDVGKDLVLEYGVPFTKVTYTHDQRILEDPYDWEEETLHRAQDRVEELAREGKFGAFVVGQGIVEDGKSIFVYDIFKPVGD